MNSTAKILVPNKEWLVRDDAHKIGSIRKSKKGYSFLRGGKQVNFSNLAELKSQVGIVIFEENIKNIRSEKTEIKNHTIYDFPCSSKPYDPVYSVKKKLPLFAKSDKSKSQYCAGHYIIQFKKGWVKSFCPKLITLERYPFQGPFKTEFEMKIMLNTANKL